jgi:SET domain-containing protein
MDDASSEKYLDNVYWVNECTKDNCRNPTDCGNRYLESNTTWHLSKCVPSTEHEVDGETILGLKAVDFIPQWAVLGEYTGVVKRNDSNSKSVYLVEIGGTNMSIDAEHEGNHLRYVNHRCINFNTVMMTVYNKGVGTVYFRTIKSIASGEFISINYGPHAKRFFKTCMCMDCQAKKPRARTEVVLPTSGKY